MRQIPRSDTPRKGEDNDAPAVQATRRASDPRRSARGGAFVPTALAVLVASPAVLQGQRMEMRGMHGTPAVVQVTGEGVISLPADLAVVGFAVETEAEVAADAARENAERMEAVIEALREQALPGLEIETFGYSLHPVYERPREGTPRQIVRYRAQNHVRVTIPDIDRVGEMIDAGIGAGANRIAGLSFDSSARDDARLDAVRLAVENARAEAEAMAMALGRRLGPAMEVQGGAQGGPIPVMRQMEMADAMAASTPIEPGAAQVRASVSIKFRLGPPLEG